MKTTKLPIVLFLLIPFNLLSQVYNVPGDFTDIQTAINSVSENDTIVLSENEYFENITINKPLTLTSEFIFTEDVNDIENTIINGNNLGSVITVENIVAGNVKFIGLSITGGNGTISDPQNFGVEMPHGGGFFIDTVDVVEINACFIFENKLLSEHNSAGGIMCSNSGLNIINTEISDNIIKGGSFLGEGAGLYLFESESYIDNCVFSNNISNIAYGEGGAIYGRNSDITIIDSEFSENVNINGGAMYLTDSDINIQNVNVLNNFGYHASGIYISNNSLKECNINNILIKENSSLSNNSSGAFSVFKAFGLISNAKITDNYSGHSCGGMAIANSDLTIENSEFSRNISTSGIGGNAGGINIYQSDIEIKNSIIEGNQLLEQDLHNKGGGIAVNSSNLVLDSVVISNNVAGQGGAIYSMMSDITLKHTLLNNNFGEQGGAIWSYGSGINILSSTLADNTAAKGSFWYSQHSDLLSVNSIIWNDNTYEIYFRQDNDTSEFNSAYSSVRDIESSILMSTETELNWLEGNIHDNPLFVNNDDNNYNLHDDSHLINMGTDFFDFNNINYIDYVPEFYFGEAPDLGAYENWNVSSDIETQNDKLISIYPNPADDHLFIQSANDWIINYEIVDLSGKTIASEHNIHMNSLSISLIGFTKGMYLLRVQTGSGISSKKLLLK